MNYEDRCRIGKVARYCEEGRKAVKLDKDGNPIAIVCCGKAKDFRKKKVIQ